MKRLALYVASVILFIGCANGQPKGMAVLPKPATGEGVATFGGGCFWAMQENMGITVMLKQQVLCRNSGYSNQQLSSNSYIIK